MQKCIRPISYHYITNTNINLNPQNSKIKPNKMARPQHFVCLKTGRYRILNTMFTINFTLKIGTFYVAYETTHYPYPSLVAFYDIWQETDRAGNQRIGSNADYLLICIYQK